jgi:folate-binding protein YgfZ
MPIEPASFEQQYQALRRGAGFVELARWSSVTFTGADRQPFLNSFCTNDVKRLAPGQRCEAFVTNVKGKTIGYGLIDCRPDELVFITVPGQAAPLIAHFERYIIRDDVQLRDTSAERAYFYIGGPLPQDVTAATQRIEWDLLGTNAGALLESATEGVAPLREWLRGQNLAPCGMAACDALRIEAGMPRFGLDFDDGNFPQEVGRDRQAVSFTKGCYLGQETVARIDALGHVNQRLVGVRFFNREVPERGLVLSRAGKNVGRVTSAAYSPRLNAALALAMVRREANAPGTRLDSSLGECEVVSLPLGAAAT